MFNNLSSQARTTWSRRTGVIAASHLLLAVRFLSLFLLVTPLWLVAFFVGSWKHSIPIHVAGFVFVVVQFFIFAIGIHQLRRFHREASLYLGVKVGWNDPPSQESKFIEWCEIRGIPTGRLKSD